MISATSQRARAKRRSGYCVGLLTQRSADGNHAPLNLGLPAQNLEFHAKHSQTTLQLARILWREGETAEVRSGRRGASRPPTGLQPLTLPPQRTADSGAAALPAARARPAPSAKPFGGNGGPSYPSGGAGTKALANSGVAGRATAAGSQALAPVLFVVSQSRARAGPCFGCPGNAEEMLKASRAAWLSVCMSALC